MATIRLKDTFPTFLDLNGNPLENGDIYIGTVNLNAETNQIAVYYDSNLTIPASQPIKTSNGYVVRNGTPTNIFFSSSYSILVKDKNGVVVYTDLNVFEDTANEFQDNVFRIIDNGDTTKKIAFEASGITTATTRTITMPDNDVTIGAVTFDDSTFNIYDNSDNTKKIKFEASGITTSNTRVITSPDRDLTIADARLDDSVTHDMSSDADYTLTDAQNQYGRIEITDTGVLLTTGRNIIVDNIEHTFLFKNSTAQTLTVKTSAGSGVAVLTSTAVELRNDTTDVIAFEAASSGATGVLSVDNMLHIQDQKTAGTDGGTFTNGAWRTRDLNTILKNTITGASLATNQITLPAGDYYIEAISPVYNVERHKAKLYNTSDTADVLWGNGSNIAPNGFAVADQQFISGNFTIAGSKTFEIQHRCSSTVSTTGFGWDSNSSFTVSYETYTDVRIWKVD